MIIVVMDLMDLMDPPPRRKLPVSEGLERIKKCKSWQADKLSLQLCVDSEKSEGESKTERV